MTNRTDMEERFIKAQVEAAALMDTCRMVALSRWRDWLSEHPGVDLESDEANYASGDIVRAVVMELPDDAVYELAALPEIWDDADHDVPGEAWPDQTIRGVIRLAADKQLGIYLDSLGV